MKNNPIRYQKGFTLLEVLIGLVVLAVGILGIAAMQVSAIKGNSKGRQVTEATNVGADRIERLLSWDYNHPALIDDDDGKDETDSDTDTNDGDGTGQDADNDGIDDDGGNFGLDDLTNPDGAADRDGDGINDIFWNIAIDYPLVNTKTIKFFVDPPGTGKRVELVFIKSDSI